MYKLSRDENDNRIITISRVSDSKVIHKYKENKYKETITKFIKIHNIDWFVGGNHYERSRFIHLDRCYSIERLENYSSYRLYLGMPIYMEII